MRSGCAANPAPSSCCGRPSVIEQRDGQEVARPLRVPRIEVQLETGPVAQSRARSARARTRRSSTFPRTIADRSSWSMPAGLPYRRDPWLPTNYVYLISIESESGFIPMFQGGGRDARFLGRLRPAGAALRVMAATIIVATASPPFAEGGHLVMARELVRALEAAATRRPSWSHRRIDSDVRAPRIWPRGAPTCRWRTRGGKVDQVISLRFPAYAVRHDRHVVWLNHRMREYYDLWDQFSRATVVARRRSRSGCAAHSSTGSIGIC